MYNYKLLISWACVTYFAGYLMRVLDVFKPLNVQLLLCINVLLWFLLSITKYLFND